MPPLPPPIRTLLLLLAATAAAAQSPDPAIPPTIVHHPKPRPSTPATINPNLILIDPAHGAADSGATFPDKTLEKDITLALAQRLQATLQTKGFTVILTRNNSTDDVPEDARIELLNRSRPLACILLHATPGGHGVHLYTSALAPPAAAPDPNAILPWDTAQAPILPQSIRLLADASAALVGIRVPLITGRVSTRPIDSLTCPAITVELTPLAPNGDINIPVADPNYQTRVTDALATALVFWRGHSESSASAAAAKAATPTPATPTPTPKPKPKPKPAPTDPANPDAPLVKKPAPIVRVTPPAEGPAQ